MASLRDLFGKLEAVTEDDLELGVVDLGIQWTGQSVVLMPFCQCSPGCCDTFGGEYMTWCVPTGVSTATFHAWGGGGGGAGSTGCSQGVAGGSGAYAKKTVSVTSGDCYEMCAGWGGACTCDCCGTRGNNSFVIGSGLDNYCAEGGYGGKVCCRAYWTECCAVTSCGCWYMDNCNKAQYYGADCGAEGVLSYAFAYCSGNADNCYWKVAFPYPGGLINKEGGVSILRNQGNACYNGHLSCISSEISNIVGSTAVGVGGASSTTCAGLGCHGTHGGPGMIRVTYK